MTSTPSANIKLNIKLIIAFQLFTRLLTFATNNLIARSIPAAHLGFIALKLDLLANTIVALSRDGIRLAAMRERDRGERNKLTLMVVPWTIVVGAVCSLIALKLTSDPLILPITPLYTQAILFYYLSTILETCAESSVIELIVNRRIKEKIGIESGAVGVRVVVLTWKLWGRTDFGSVLSAFSQAQLIQAITLNILHAIYNRNTGVPHSNMPTKKSLSLASALTVQEFFKYFLSQGDLFIITTFSTLRDQGVYSVVSSYGSLVLRMVMQPVEEASLHHFASVKQDDGYFCLMLKSVAYIGLVFVCYASFFTDPVIAFLLGRKWLTETSASDSLSAYCYLVAAAGVSGFLDSFVRAKIDEKWLAWQRSVSIGNSVVYCGLAVFLILWKGSVGLIAAGAINFLIRAALNVFFIQNTHKIPWKSAMIPKEVLASFFAVFLVNLVLFLVKRADWALRISIAVSLFIINSSLLIKRDSKFVQEFKSQWIK